MLDLSVQEDTFIQVQEAVDRRLDEVIEVKEYNEHEVGALNFLRKPKVSEPRFSEFAFGTWSEWLYCSENCGVGKTSRNRQCTANGEIQCSADGSCIVDSCVYESKECQIQKCLTCANFQNFCNNQINTECKDLTLDTGEVTVG